MSAKQTIHRGTVTRTATRKPKNNSKTTGPKRCPNCGKFMGNGRK